MCGWLPLGWVIHKPIMPIAICTISSACGWYMKVPGRRAVNSYTKVLPAGMCGWVSPATPSMPLGKRWPCQCTLVCSGRRLVTKMRTRSPSTTSMVGPGLWPL